MDLLFKKYASPFVLIDSYILCGRFEEFVMEFLTLQNEDKTWEFFLHKVFDKSYVDFCKELENTTKNANMSDEQIETTVNEARIILKNFNPAD